MEVTKFTQEEMQEIASLQAEYQQKIYQLGQVKLDEKSLEDAKDELAKRRNELFKEWSDLQKSENELIQKLAGKYGDGSLNLKDGTFTPNPKSSDAVQNVQPVVANPSQSAAPVTDVTPVGADSQTCTGNVGNVGNVGTQQTCTGNVGTNTCIIE